MNNKNYNELLEEVEFLRAERKRLTKEVEKYKEKYDIEMTHEEIEEAYKNYDWN